MKEIFEVEEMIKKHKIDYDTIEVVLHSYNILAKEFHQKRLWGEEYECYNKKEIIMEYLLDPIEIHVINGKRYLVYEGTEHLFHEPFTSLSSKEVEFYTQILEEKEMDKWEYTGKRIRGRLNKEECDEFYNMVIENDFIFYPIS